MKANQLIVAKVVNNRVQLSGYDRYCFIYASEVSEPLGLQPGDVNFEDFDLPMDEDGDLDLIDSFTVKEAQTLVDNLQRLLDHLVTLKGAKSAQIWCHEFNAEEPDETATTDH